MLISGAARGFEYMQTYINGRLIDHRKLVLGVEDVSFAGAILPVKVYEKRGAGKQPLRKDLKPRYQSNTQSARGTWRDVGIAIGVDKVSAVEEVLNITL